MLMQALWVLVFRRRLLYVRWELRCVDMFVEKPENLKGKDIQAYCGQAENSILLDT